MTRDEKNPHIIEEEEGWNMGIGRQAYQEIIHLIGRSPTMEELSTLLAMWNSNGRQQTLKDWLKRQSGIVSGGENYIYNGVETNHKKIKEPLVKECIKVAHELAGIITEKEEQFDTHSRHGDLIYLVGNISSEFSDSEYARQYLHIAKRHHRNNEVNLGNNYIEMILGALETNNKIGCYREVTSGGLFLTLITMSDDNKGSSRGFDIITCREVRLDAFLFGEEKGRYIATVEEQHDDLFLLKMDEAKINCCFLGRVTKGRVIVDGMDFGAIGEYKKER